MERRKKADDEEEVISSCTDVDRHPIGGVSCSKIVLLDIFRQIKRPDNTIRVYALIDEQSNTSMIMISPKLADEPEIVGPGEKYFLSTCSSSREIGYGHRVQGLMVTSIKRITMKLPTLVECGNISRDKREIQSPQLVKKFPLGMKTEIELLIGRDAPELKKVTIRNGPKGTPWAHRSVGPLAGKFASTVKVDLSTFERIALSAMSRPMNHTLTQLYFFIKIKAAV